MRRRHPILARYRQSRSIAVAVLVMGVQLALIGVFAFLNLMGAVTLVMMLLEVPEHRNAEELTLLAVYSLLVLPVATGAWLTVAFHHIRRWKVWLGWIAFMLLPFAVLGAGLAISEEFILGDSTILFWSEWSFEAMVVTSTILFTIVASGPLLVIMTIAIAGIPLGHGLVWIGRWLQRSLWRTRLRRARHWRIA